jgi:thiol-disulfide isomerase/thioredoxin
MNRLLIVLLVAFAAISCKKESSFVKLSGKITHPNSERFTLHNLENGDVVKEFGIDKDGSFSDTITLPKGRYFVNDGLKNFMLYLAPGTDLTISYDGKDFEKTLKFEGTGKEVNTYITEKYNEQSKLANNMDEILHLSHEDFLKKIKSIEKESGENLKNLKNLDKEFISSDSTDTQGFLSYLEESYLKSTEINKLVGKPSPTFDNYENFSGGTTSLKDLKGKYVYIDVWATWCKPCVAEIPALKELEAELGDKMYFVSISVDEPTFKEAWKTMIQEKGMKGIQLFANATEETTFDREYKITSIPRFILIDPNGNIVKPDASRPSHPKTKEFLISLLNK